MPRPAQLKESLGIRRLARVTPSECCVFLGDTEFRIRNEHLGRLATFRHEALKRGCPLPASRGFRQSDWEDLLRELFGEAVEPASPGDEPARTDGPPSSDVETGGPAARDATAGSAHASKADDLKARLGIVQLERLARGESQVVFQDARIRVPNERLVSLATFRREALRKGLALPPAEGFRQSDWDDLLRALFSAAPGSALPDAETVTEALLEQQVAAFLRGYALRPGASVNRPAGSGYGAVPSSVAHRAFVADTGVALSHARFGRLATRCFRRVRTSAGISYIVPDANEAANAPRSLPAFRGHSRPTR